MIKYIVVTNNNSWGVGKTIIDAFSNANLFKETVASWFADGVETYGHNVVEAVAETEKSWNEYGREEVNYREDPVDCMLYIWDDEVWEDYQVSHMNGAVTYMPRRELFPDRTDDKWREMYENCYAHVKWSNGMILPRKPPVTEEKSA